MESQNIAFATPDDDIVMLSGTTLSWLSSPDSAFPASQGKDAAPGSVTKSTQVNDTLRSTHASVSLVGAAMFHTNAVDIDLTDNSGGGAIGNMDPLARDGDNHTHDTFLSFNARTSTQFNFAMSKPGSTPLWVGEVRLIKAWRRMLLTNPFTRTIINHGPPPEATFLGAPIRWTTDIRSWVWEGECVRGDELSALLDLYVRSYTLNRPFVFIEQWGVRKAFLVQFSESTIAAARRELNYDVMRIKLEEVPSGTPPPSS